jgi:hypothetical protein
LTEEFKPEGRRKFAEGSLKVFICYYYYIVIMYYLKKLDLEIYRKNSLEIAKEAGLLDDLVLNELGSIELKVSGEERPKGIWYGYAIYEGDIWPDIGSRVEVYKENPASGMPKYLREIFNQSGMDHELIGHIGYYLLGKPHGESRACVVQKIMAEKRAKKSLVWKLAAKAIPYVQNRHK